MLVIGRRVRNIIIHTPKATLTTAPTPQNLDQLLDDLANNASDDADDIEDLLVPLHHPVLHSPAPASTLALDTLTLSTAHTHLSSSSSSSLGDLCHALVDTLVEHSALGVAAPQIGVPARAFVIDASTCPLPSAPKDKVRMASVWLNPEVVEEESGNTVWLWEGCLSLPGVHGWVPRVDSVLASGLVAHLDSDLTWSVEHIDSLPLDGLHARVLLHENDHLDGILFPDRVQAPRFVVPSHALADLAADDPSLAADYPSPAAVATPMGSFSPIG